MLERPQRITQAHLRTLDKEPHRFRRLYLDGLEVPRLSRNAAAAERGQQFHQLMQQRSLNLPIDALVASDPDLQRYFAAYERQPPLTIAGDSQAEYPLAAAVQGFQLYGVPDLLVRNSQQAQMVDWKTYRQPRQREDLEPDWQTQLYLFLLKETLDYPAEALSMVYWFAEAPEGSVAIAYNTALHQQVGHRITELLTQLDEWLQHNTFPTLDVLPEADPFLFLATIPPQPLP